MCHFRSRSFQNRTAERLLMREAEAILRFVDDLKRACSTFVDALGDYSRSKSFNNVIFPVDFSGVCVCIMKLL